MDVEYHIFHYYLVHHQPVEQEAERQADQAGGRGQDQVFPKYIAVCLPGVETKDFNGGDLPASLLKVDAGQIVDDYELQSSCEEDQDKDDIVNAGKSVVCSFALRVEAADGDDSICILNPLLKAGVFVFG